MRLSVLPLAALLMLSGPAFGSSLVAHDPVSVTKPANAGTGDGSVCSFPLSLQTSSPLSPKAGDETAVGSAVVDNPWASGATSQWNAGMNRAVDHLVRPSGYVNVYATQTGGDLRGHDEGANRPNQTFAAFEVVIH